MRTQSFHCCDPRGIAWRSAMVGLMDMIRESRALCRGEAAKMAQMATQMAAQMAAHDGNGHQSGLGESRSAAGHRDCILGSLAWPGGLEGDCSPHRRSRSRPTSPGERSANQTPARRNPPCSCPLQSLSQVPHVARGPHCLNSHVSLPFPLTCFKPLPISPVFLSSLPSGHRNFAPIRRPSAPPL